MSWDVMGFAVGGYGVATVLKIVQYSPTMPSLFGWGGFLKTFFFPWPVFNNQIKEKFTWFKFVTWALRLALITSLKI